MGDGHLMEYSYGDWDFYALNKYKWYIGASKLLFSEGSGLGRRILAHPGDDEALSIAVDGNGDAYVTGFTSGSSGPTPASRNAT